MNCPNCGHNNRPNAKFCAQCRASLTPVVKSNMGACPQCNKQNRQDAKFCGGCGYTFTKPTHANVATQTQTPSRGSLYLGFAAIILVLISSGIFIAIRQQDGSSSDSARLAATATVEHVVTTIAATETPLLSDEPTAVLEKTTPIPKESTPAPEESTSAPEELTPASTEVSIIMTSEPVATAVSLSEETLNRALLATVQIITRIDERRGAGEASLGSGSVLTTNGYILTNFHVIGDPETGQLYNRAGRILIAISPPSLREPPQVQYIAQVVQENQALDLALLKIVSTQDGTPLPDNLGLTTIPVGNSDTVKIGHELSIIGFPGLGGDTVTFTKGTVSGFLTDTGENWIKTDAELNSGNSGGTAINRAGELIGIPSAAASETIGPPGKIGLVRPVNLAQPLIDMALRDAEEK